MVEQLLWNIQIPQAQPGCKSETIPVMKRAVWQIRKPLELLRATSKIWKVVVAGFCGSITHTVLMLVKTKLGILEPFQPYQSLQIALGYWTGEYVHPLLPWLISYVNGSTAAGLAFANFYWHLPGSSGVVKGFIAGVLGWLVMDLIFFPLLGLGLFATGLGLGPRPALFSLAMMLAYSVVMGTVYGIVYSGSYTARGRIGPHTGDPVSEKPSVPSDGLTTIGPVAAGGLGHQKYSQRSQEKRAGPSSEAT
jgi:uncharacterized protein DUF6789